MSDVCRSTGNTLQYEHHRANGGAREQLVRVLHNHVDVPSNVVCVCTNGAACASEGENIRGWHRQLPLHSLSALPRFTPNHANSTSTERSALQHKKRWAKEILPYHRRTG